MDDADITQDRAEAQARFEAQNAAALASRRILLTECRDCGEPITELRQALFACRCLECQLIEDRRGRIYARAPL